MVRRTERIPSFSLDVQPRRVVLPSDGFQPIVFVGPSGGSPSLARSNIAPSFQEALLPLLFSEKLNALVPLVRPPLPLLLYPLPLRGLRLRRNRGILHPRPRPNRPFRHAKPTLTLNPTIFTHF
jgi:hypothetical protein